MGGKSSAPAAPNYQALLTQQGEQNSQLSTQNTIANRPDITTPTGSTTWTQTPGNAFNAQAYLAANPDVAAAAADPSQNGGMSPAQYALYHANTYGVTEGRSYDSTGDKLTSQYLSQFGADGTSPATYTENQTLTPTQQALFNQSQTNQGTGLQVQAQQLGVSGGETGLAAQQLGLAQQSLSQPASYASELQPVGTIAGPSASSPVSYNANTLNDATNAAYQQATQYLDPQWQQAQQAEDAKLQASGLSTDSDAYKTAMNNFALQKQQAYTDARDSAINAGQTAATAEEQRALAANQNQFSQSQAQSDFAQSEATRQQTQQLQDIGVQSSDRQNALQNFLNLATGGNSGSLTGAGYQVPSFSGETAPADPTQGTDISGAAQDQFQAALNAVNANNAQSAQTAGAGASAATGITVALATALGSSF